MKLEHIGPKLQFIGCHECNKLFRYHSCL